MRLLASNDLVRTTNAAARVLSALTALGAFERKRQPAHVPWLDRFGGGYLLSALGPLRATYGTWVE